MSFFRKAVWSLLLINIVHLSIFSLHTFAGGCGDVNNSGSINIMDVAYVINYLYKTGSTPQFISQPKGTITDYDGNIYNTVAIGSSADVDHSGKIDISDIIYLIDYLYYGGDAPNCSDGQVWMAQNLKVTHYRNGDSIQKVPDYDDWFHLSTGAYCSYFNNDIFVDDYGRMYNWQAVNDTRNIAPDGWHVPSQDEWQILIDILGGGNSAGGKMKDTTHWTSPDPTATNESGFCGLPGGFRDIVDDYGGMPFYAGLWTATESNIREAFYWSLYHGNSRCDASYTMKQDGFSIRCVKD
ncbi:Major paralogous domain protein (modular protein) [Candidatus Zixiibacteriota bacterium]|nr:Major paralogous domain protein (modular protein) [candidate division Zixibacteria bacterium]